MKTTAKAKCTMLAAAFLLSAAAAGSVYAQEGTNPRLIPSQERIPNADWRINPEYIIPPIGSANSSPAPAEKKNETSAPAPVVRNSPQFKAPLITKLERGKWYVQIGVYSRADHVEDAIKRAGAAVPIVIQNAGTDTNPMYRVLLGPFTQNESKTMLQRFRDKGYDAFLRRGN